MTTLAETIASMKEQSNQPLRVTGPTAIAGSVHVQGSKNAANKLVAAMIAVPGVYRISNFPMILDPLELLAIAEWLGATVELCGDNVVAVDTRAIQNKAIPYERTKSTTSAFGFAGALLGRFGSVTIGKPGGDQIGPRPVDLHIDGFVALGAQVQDSPESISATLPDAPKGQVFTMRMASTGAAVNYILAVAGSDGVARIENTPVDGDMQAMYELLRLSGVEIVADGSRVIVNGGSKASHGTAIEFACSPDRNDAFTWLAYGALSRDGLRVSRASFADMEQGVKVLRSIGVRVQEEGGDTYIVQAPLPENTLQDVTIVAGLAREFHSDWTPMLEVVLATLRGSARVVDTLFAQRVRQAELLQQMGANVAISGGQAPEGITLHFPSSPAEARYIIDIQGPNELKPISTDVGYDVRACAAMVMAASQASGVSQLSHVQALYRGYEDVIARLQSVGVNVGTLY